MFTNEQKFVIGLWLRVVAAGAFLLLLTPLTLLGLDFPYSKCSAAYYGLTALVLVNAPYWWIARVRGFPITDFYVHWFVDLLLISLVLYGLGGALVPSAITAYILIVITSAVFLSKRTAYAVATGGTIAYVASLMAERYGMIDPRYDIAMPQLSIGMQLLVIAVPVLVLYLVAYIAGTLGDQLNKINALLVLQNRELNEQNDKLDRMRSELDFQSKVLTHDIRSPVSAVYGALGELRNELVSAGDRDESHARLLAIARENLSRVEDMIDAVQQAQEGMESAERIEQIKIGDLIEELRVECHRELSRKRTRLTVEAQIPTIFGMRGRLLVMFRNLITNAIRYLPDDGSGSIQVGVVDQDGEWRIYVRDNGPGVPTEFQKIIFEMFRKAPQKTKSPGMGLGLSLVRTVAAQHNGRAWVTSDGKTGSTFWIAFPKSALQQSTVAIQAHVL